MGIKAPGAAPSASLRLGNGWRNRRPYWRRRPRRGACAFGLQLRKDFLSPPPARLTPHPRLADGSAAAYSFPSSLFCLALIMP